MERPSVRSQTSRLSVSAVEVEDTPITRGMLEKVQHLVTYEVID